MSMEQRGFYGEPVSPYRGSRVKRSAEGKRADKREYRANNREQIKEYNREWQASNRERIKASRRDYEARNQERITSYQHKRRTDDNRELLELLGNECKCCGEAYLPALAVDHVNGDGAEHKKELRYNPSHSYFLKHLKAGTLKRPIQLLCHNCNIAKGTDLTCPCRYAKAENGGRGRNVPEPFFVG